MRPRRAIAKLTRRLRERWGFAPQISSTGSSLWDGVRPTDAILRSGLFDPVWYAARVPGLTADLAASHYYTHGVAEGRQPSPHFDALGYLAANPDVAASGLNPILHWVRYGCREGRRSPLIGEASKASHVLSLCNPFELEDSQAISDPSFLISVVTPTYNTSPELLQQLYTSLHNQTYGNWEWCVCDDASTNSATLAKLVELSRLDPRVRVTLADQNRGISSATNRAADASKGNYIALVDHDDLLSRSVFLEIFRRWSKSHADIYYTDECKLSMDNLLYDFFHKPEWSPVFLESTMYIGHLTVYERELFFRLKGFRSEYDGTQDYDLALRAARQTRRVEHVPVVGYLWRAIPGSTAVSLSEKSYALDRQREAVLDHARTLNPRASVLPGERPGLWRPVFPLPKAKPLLSYVMPTGAGRRMVRGESVDLISNCLNHLVEKKFYSNCEYVIVHNGDLSARHAELLGKMNNVKLVHYEEAELNLARKINLGVAAATGEYVCLLNDDIEVIDEGGGEQILGFLHAHPQVGAVAPLCLFEDGRVQHNGVVLLQQGPSHFGVLRDDGFEGHFGNLLCRRETFGVTGAMLFCRRDDFMAVGGFDEAFPLNYNDVDYCQKLARIGKTSVVDPGVKVYHYESATKVGTFRAEKEQLFRKWPGLRDPYFNQSFNQRSPYFELANSAREADNDPIGFEEWLDRRIADRAERYPSTGQLKLSVCVPIYNQTKAQLQELYVSYRMQTYANRELVLVDDASTSEETRQWLDNLAAAPDVRLVRLAENRGIAGASRAMLEACTGDYYLPVDADDFLTIDALSIMAHFAEKYPHSHLFYSDEFKSNPQSEKFSPYRKPPFDPFMIANCCYVTHLMAFRASTMRRLNAYADDRATWCHDWDSTLRCLDEGFEPIHVPELLYAWRINPGSTASMETGEKPAAVESQRFVLERSIKSRGLERRLAIRPNAIRPHTGMWAVEALVSVDMEHVDAEWFWTLTPDKRRASLRDLLATSKCDWLLFNLTSTAPADAARAFSALIHWNSEVMGVSGLLSDASGDTILWGGADLEDGELVHRHDGSSLTSGGYHGQLFCQRRVDVMAPYNMALRRDLIEALLEEGAWRLGPPDFMMAAGRVAASREGFLTITPHVLDEIPQSLRRQLPSLRQSFNVAARA